MRLMRISICPGFGQWTALSTSVVEEGVDVRSFGRQSVSDCATASGLLAIEQMAMKRSVSVSMFTGMDWKNQLQIEQYAWGLGPGIGDKGILLVGSESELLPGVDSAVLLLPVLFAALVGGDATNRPRNTFPPGEKF